MGRIITRRKCGLGSLVLFLIRHVLSGPSSQLVLPVSSFLLCVSTRFYENGFAGQMKKMASFEGR